MPVKREFMEIPVEIRNHDGIRPEESNPESLRETEPKTALQPETETIYLDQLRRMKAEFDNYRKRVEREKADYYSLARGKVISSMLPVLDDLERMVGYTRGMEGEFASGIELIQQKMRAVLASEGLEDIGPVGRPFDPEYHEAIESVEAGPDKEGLVIEELQRGYLLQGRLLRPSRVRVGKRKEEGLPE
jgi:molecular chaperone GrpE